MSRRAFCAGMALTSLSLPLLTGCSDSGNDNSAIIFSCNEGEPNESMIAAIHRDLPQYDIRLHYMTTGNCAARLKTEGDQCEADVILGLEGGYLRQVEDSLEVLDGFDFDAFEPELLDGSRKYLPFRRESACIALNDDLMSRDCLPQPDSYDALLDSAYAGKVCMPNPKTSGTGYNFLKSLVNARGEEKAFAYFDALAQNVYQFTSSGSGPVNALVQGEAVIGLGMTYQAVGEINAGSPLSIHFFAEGSPWTMNGVAAAKGRMEKPAVRALMEWMFTTGIMNDKRKFVPDKVFKDQDVSIPNYPTDIPFADMTGLFDMDEKKRLLEKWKY